MKIKELPKIERLKPFLKWAGGKSQLLPWLIKFFPKKFNNYYEPFLGGGAIFFYLQPKAAFLNDINHNLINAYINIKKRSGGLVRGLRDLEEKYKSINPAEQKEFFYKIRNIYNRLPVDSLKKSIYLIFLNKTGYNGMYRENSCGEFNIPFGKHKRPTILDEENISLISKALKNTILSSVSFEKAVVKAKRGDFIYFDPPYYPINETSNFTSYTKDIFLKEEQQKLASLFYLLHKKGCKIMLSNSDTIFIRKLYKRPEFKIVSTKARRFINCIGKKRNNVRELLILNY